MTDSEAEILELENLFPTLADSVFKEACEKALASGLTVMQSIKGVIYEVSPDGTRKFVKNIEPGTPVTPGTKIVLQ